MELQTAVIAISSGSTAAPPSRWDKGWPDKHHIGNAGYPLKLHFQIPCVFPVRRQIFPVPIYLICDYYRHKTDLADLSCYKRYLEIFAANFKISFTSRIRNLQFEQTKSPVFSLCFGKIPKFPVFCLTGNFFGHFPCFPCAVGTLSICRSASSPNIRSLVKTKGSLGPHSPDGQTTTSPSFIFRVCSCLFHRDSDWKELIRPIPVFGINSALSALSAHFHGRAGYKGQNMIITFSPLYSMF